MKIKLKAITLLFFLLTLNGCESLSFYTQSIHGHFSLLHNKQPIEKVLKDQNTETKTKAKLQLVLQAREFAKASLNLPIDKQYVDYVQLKNQYVLWNVVATKEFSLSPVLWCYPIVGCVSYRGYYKKENAEKKAEQLSKSNHDVSLRGVSAYSTLGWFNDPVLSTFLKYSDIQLAGLIFHELAHQKLYFNNDTVFNESFAKTIELTGMQRWIQHHPEYQKDFQRYQKSMQRQDQFIKLLLTTRDRLANLYQKNISKTEMRNKKKDLLKQLKTDYEQLKQTTWQGSQQFDNWFKQPTNNARLVSIATYYDLTAPLKKILAHLVPDPNGSLDPFYRYCEQLRDLTPEKRHQIIKEWSN